jgi:hypothetical protein
MLHKSDCSNSAHRQRCAAVERILEFATLYCMRTTWTICLFALTTGAFAADNPAAIREVLREFNKALRQPEARAMQKFFTSSADYGDLSSKVTGRDAIASLLSAGQGVWSERTPPALQEHGMRMIGQSAALVDAYVVQYGSTVVKSMVPVVLVLENEGGVWKISSWRASACTLPPQP